MANPSLTVPNFEKIVALGKKHGVATIVDNTFSAAGYIVAPLKLGVNIVVSSATKWIGGHGTTIGGVIVDGGSFAWDNGRYPLMTDPAPGYHGASLFGMLGKATFIARARIEGLRDLGFV